MTFNSLKVPKKVNPAITKGFRDLELSFLDYVPREKCVKREFLAFSIGGGVSFVGGSSSLVLSRGVTSKAIESSTRSRKRKLGNEVANESMNPRLKIAMEKLAHVFFNERHENDVLIGTNRLLEQVVTSLGEGVKFFGLFMNIAIMRSMSALICFNISMLFPRAAHVSFVFPFSTKLTKVGLTSETSFSCMRSGSSSWLDLDFVMIFGALKECRFSEGNWSVCSSTRYFSLVTKEFHKLQSRG
ncbi:hypothetical protein LWI29_002279 [Acer saccharum]|uniref:Uncharacterized protein n=1 Tax=Acer saccharum TaxID=4024 RepID=A0AA39V643_ACESA|nr:hypothetical protein LWI29_002279 [Acer saccharum]